MVTAKVNAPNYQAYGNSDLEKAFAQGLAGDTGGYGGTLMSLLMGAGRERNQMVDRYSTDLAATNQLQVALAQRELQQEMLKEYLTQAPHFAKAGLPLDAFPGFGAIGNTTDPRVLDSSGLQRELLKAEIQSKIAAAANSGASGKTTYTVEQPYGTNPGPSTMKISGKDAAAVEAAREAWVRSEAAKRAPGGPYASEPGRNAAPGAPAITGVPTTTQQQQRPQHRVGQP
jgi:hypothetical protein